jgi:hypothetical protein
MKIEETNGINTGRQVGKPGLQTRSALCSSPQPTQENTHGKISSRRNRAGCDHRSFDKQPLHDPGRRGVGLTYPRFLNH